MKSFSENSHYLLCLNGITLPTLIFIFTTSPKLAYPLMRTTNWKSVEAGVGEPMFHSMSHVVSINKRCWVWIALDEQYAEYLLFDILIRKFFIHINVCHFICNKSLTLIQAFFCVIIKTKYKQNTYINSGVPSVLRTIKIKIKNLSLHINAFTPTRRPTCTPPYPPFCAEAISQAP